MSVNINFSNLQNVSRIQLFVTTSTATTLVQVTIVYHSGYYHKLLIYLLTSALDPLCSFLSRAHSFILLRQKSDHVPCPNLTIAPLGKAKVNLACLTSPPSICLSSLSPVQCPPGSFLNMLNKPCLNAFALYSSLNSSPNEHDLITSMRCLAIENCNLTPTQSHPLPLLPFFNFLHHTYHLTY